MAEWEGTEYPVYLFIIEASYYFFACFALTNYYWNLRQNFKLFNFPKSIGFFINSLNLLDSRIFASITTLSATSLVRFILQHASQVLRETPEFIYKTCVAIRSVFQF